MNARTVHGGIVRVSHTHTHRADVIENAVALLLGRANSTTNAQELEWSNRLQHSAHRANVATEEARNVNARHQHSNQKHELQPLEKTCLKMKNCETFLRVAHPPDSCSNEHIGLPENHPRQVGKQSSGGREHLKRSLTEKSERCVTFDSTAPADENGHDHRKGNKAPLDILDVSNDTILDNKYETKKHKKKNNHGHVLPN